MIVTTRDDLVPQERQRTLAASIPGAEVFEVDGDHVACVAAAEAFVPALVAACRPVIVMADPKPSPAASSSGDVMVEAYAYCPLRSARNA